MGLDRDVERRSKNLIFLALTVSASSGRVSVSLTPSTRTSRMRGHVPGDHSYLDLLFDGSKVRRDAAAD